MKKMNDPDRAVMKPLADLTLLDRFLFACVMEDRETMELVLSIILGGEIHLAEQPQAEREMRTVPCWPPVRLILTGCSLPALSPLCPLIYGGMEGTDIPSGWNARRKEACFWKTGRPEYFSIPMALCRRE